VNGSQYRFLLSERATLTDMIERAPSGSIITTMSLKHRLKEVEQELAEYPDGILSRPVRAALTFAGKSVVGSLGIRAEFGSDAVKAFATAVTQVGASRHAPLGSRGRVPDSEEYQLLITGIAPGSFGFQVEEASPQLGLITESHPVEQAIGRVKEILEASVGTDEQLADAISETDSRALGAVRRFLDTVAKDDAVCTLEFRDDVFRFRDSAQVRHSEQRLSHENIRDDTVTFKGTFQGFLPSSRRAEFLVSDVDAELPYEVAGTIIAGQVDPGVDDDVDINEILGKKVTVESRTRRVGSGPRRHLFQRVRIA